MDLFTPLIVAKINDLLEAVNDGVKPKDQFVFKEAVYHKKHVIFCADSRVFGVMFNVLTDTGEFPEGLSACWRSWCHIKREFEI